MGRVVNIHPALIPAFCGQGMYGDHVHQAVLDYGARWAIEPTFADFKSRGFELEDSQLEHADRLDRLILIMAVAVVIQSLPLLVLAIIAYEAILSVIFGIRAFAIRRTVVAEMAE